MIENKLYMRAFSAILSVMTIFSVIYNSYAGGPDDLSANENGHVQSVKILRVADLSKTSDLKTGDDKPPLTPLESDALQRVININKQLNETTRKELLQLIDLYYNVLTYCDVTKYKWDDDDREAINCGASQTLTTKQKEDIDSLFRDVLNVPNRFDFLTFSVDSNVISASCGCGGQAAAAYARLHKICKLLLPSPGYVGFGARDALSVKSLFLSYRLPTPANEYVCLPLLLRAPLAEMTARILLSEKLRSVPEPMSAEFANALGTALGLTKDAAYNFIQNVLIPCAKSAYHLTRDAVDNTLEDVEKKLPTAASIATTTQTILQTSVPFACLAIIGSFALVKTISFGFKYMDIKCFGSPADTNERKGPRPHNTTNDQPQRLQQPASHQPIAKNISQHS